MILEVTGADKARFADIFREMHRQRHAAYVIERGWTRLVGRQGQEIDAYDRAETRYLVCLENGAVEGSLRLMPTTGPHLLSEVFPHYVDAGRRITGDSTVELTRFCVAPEARRRGRSRWVVARLSLALFEHARSAGLTQIVSLVDTFLLPRMRAMHWSFAPIGPRIHYREGVAVAVAIEPSAETVGNLRAILAEPEHRPSGPPRPSRDRVCGKGRLDLVATEA